MRTPRNKVWQSLLLLISLSGPAGVAAFLAASSEAPLMLAQAGPAPGNTSTPGSTSGIPALTTGVLFTTGTTIVDWNGVKIPVSNGTYAYMGGEPVDIADNAMGILQLEGGSTIVLCPGSYSRVELSPTGKVRSGVDRGTIRFLFPPGTDFEVDAGGHLIDPASGGGGDDPIVGEVTTGPSGSLLAAALNSSLDIETAGGRSHQAKSGELVTVPGPGPGDAVESLTIPESIMGTMQVRSSSGGVGTDYLCRSEELDRVARAQVVALAEAAEAAAVAEAEAAIDAAPPAAAAPEAAPAPEAPAPVAPPPAAAPPVAPPAVPPVAVAPPGAPNPFDPNVLPPPAAGPVAQPTPLVLPPAVPPPTGSGGGGGGFAGSTVSPS